MAGDLALRTEDLLQPNNPSLSSSQLEGLHDILESCLRRATPSSSRTRALYDTYAGFIHKNDDDRR